MEQTAASVIDLLANEGGSRATAGALLPQRHGMLPDVVFGPQGLFRADIVERFGVFDAVFPSQFPVVLQNELFDIVSFSPKRASSTTEQGVGDAHGGKDCRRVMHAHDVRAAQDGRDHGRGVSNRERGGVRQGCKRRPAGLLSPPPKNDPRLLLTRDSRARLAMRPAREGSSPSPATMACTNDLRELPTRRGTWKRRSFSRPARIS